MRFAKWQGLGNDYLIVDASRSPGAADPGGHRAALRPPLRAWAPTASWCTSAPTGRRPRRRRPHAHLQPRRQRARDVRQRHPHVRALSCAPWAPSRPTSSPSRPSPAPSSRACCPTDGCGCTWARPASGRPTIVRDGPGAATEVVDETLDAAGGAYRFTFVDVGNPHCVIQVRRPGRPALARDRAGHRTARLLPQPGERGVHPRRARRLGVACGSGNGAWGRPRPAGPARPRWGRRPCGWDWPRVR